jgi:hypothetical protein
MAQDFSLRLITQRAAGGDPIVRERRLAGPDLSIGRAPDNDIVLTDLAVDPRHALIRSTAPGRVLVESLSGLPFEAEGKPVERIELALSDIPQLKFGDYTIALANGLDDTVQVVVTREEAEHAPNPSIFSLRARMFGRRRMAWALGAGIFLLCLLVPLFGSGLLRGSRIHPDQQWSTGPLSQAHAFLEADCNACHQRAFVAVRDSACLSCHSAKQTPQQLASMSERLRREGSAFRPILVAEHGAEGIPADEIHKRLRKAAPPPKGAGALAEVVSTVFNHRSDRCASCHLEHTTPLPKPGTRVAMASRPAKPTLVVVRDCQACHARLKMRLPDTRLIDTPDWSRHPRFRPQVTRGGRDEAHPPRLWLTSNPREETGLTFSHDLHLDPIGGPARQAVALNRTIPGAAPMTCASCHQRDGKGFRPVEMMKDCEACHSLAFTRGPGGELVKLPHKPPAEVAAFLNANYPAQAAGLFRAAFSSGGACMGCHTITWSNGAPTVAPVHLAQRFLPRGDFDHSVKQHGGGSRDEMVCRDCHRSAAERADPDANVRQPWRVSTQASDLMIPDKGSCDACHGNPHAKAGDQAPADCQECHSFHTPGAATCAPQDRPLSLTRWSASEPPRCEKPKDLAAR